ncbi:SDR family oxidoreductase [Streptomyces griseolus]|uniref:SDR family oxidoreductase n=1 Tax=Streptomyces griseolus TaxID=1909 RepID=UPI00224349C5|nr:SDR family oxidoreductase [Streptomyces griseolus]MCW8220242.1 SDR family oxidoreductase [Streptomyces griseolus]
MRSTPQGPRSAPVTSGHSSPGPGSFGPAFIRTGLEAALEPAVRADLDAQHPAGRMGDPEAVARAAVFLAGDGASFINGAYVPVDGGFLTW